MATPRKTTTSTRKAKTTTSNDTAAPAAIVQPETIAKHTNRVNATIDLKNVETVTALKLRRQLITGETNHLSMFISSDEYTQLAIMGMQNKLTVDELVRGCISQALSSNDPIGSLKHYIPLLS